MSRIEWTGKTWNPITGCTKISRGCGHCYMYRQYPRLRAMSNPGYPATPDTVTMLPDRLEHPLRIAKPSRIFVCSMSDLFHQDVDRRFIDQIFEVMDEAIERRGHIFQVLTKRPHLAVRWWLKETRWTSRTGSWPDRIHIGTTVEEQQVVHRIPALERLPAERRFISAEPLLSGLDLSKWLRRGTIDWVIAGGESGPGARPMDLDWARALRDQCEENRVPFFLKQMGGHPDKRAGEKAVLDGRRHTEEIPV